jgi:hypothetical protein
MIDKAPSRKLRLSNANPIENKRVDKSWMRQGWDCNKEEKGKKKEKKKEIVITISESYSW